MLPDALYKQLVPMPPGMSEAEVYIRKQCLAKLLLILRMMNSFEIVSVCVLRLLTTITYIPIISLIEHMMFCRTYNHLGLVRIMQRMPPQNRNASKRLLCGWATRNAGPQKPRRVGKAGR